jgi:hypothetical protein
VNSNGHALGFCPKFQEDREIVTMAILNRPDAIQYSPKFCKDHDLVFLTLNNSDNDRECYYAIRYYCQYHQDNKQLVLKTISIFPHALHYYPNFQNDLDLFVECKNTDIYKYIPIQLINSLKIHSFVKLSYGSSHNKSPYE